LNGPLEWFGAIGAIVAAAMIAADLGRRWTGWGFVLFVVVSIAWIASGLLNSTIPITVQNALLLAVNGWGVWQYLLSPKKKREIEKAEELADEAKREVECENAA
jgi:4-amino-4-deoxy-L-arabinose transferase-like glycosyltransferase